MVSKSTTRGFALEILSNHSDEVFVEMQTVVHFAGEATLIS